MENLENYIKEKKSVDILKASNLSLMPAILLGIIPAIVSLYNGSLMLLILGIIFISAAAGDFMVVWILRKESPGSYVQDHPSEIGCFVYHEP